MIVDRSLSAERRRPDPVIREIDADGIRVVTIDCADESTPEAAYAAVGPHVRVGVGSRLGRFTALGPGAVLGMGTRLGTWSKIGPYSRIGHGVQFGQWASVGMDCIVDSGSVLGEHEYVRSGFHRHLSGRTTRIEAVQQEVRFHHLYDGWQNGGSNDGDLDLAMEADVDAYRAGIALAAQFREYLEIRSARSNNPVVDALEKMIGRRIRPEPDDAFLDWKPVVEIPHWYEGDGNAEQMEAAIPLLLGPRT